MPRYIDAEKLICSIDGSECLDTERDYEEILKRIEECETADVAEVKHARWIKDKDKERYFKCSNCKMTKPYIEIYGDNPTKVYWESLFCRCCGAKMDGNEIL